MRLNVPFLFVLLGCLLAAACATTSSEPKLIAEVAAQPDGASITYQGNPVGNAPITVPVRTIKDVLAIDARLEGKEVVEKRVHVISQDRVEITFTFGTEGSPIAKALGLAKIVIFDYSDRTTFELDKAELMAQFLPMLEQQAELLKTSFDELDVFVCGFTDSTGSTAHNLDLSLQRAEAVAAFLQTQGVDPSRLRVQGFGEEYPIADNNTSEGRTHNRRTEIVLPQ